ncbi:hypothetical protein PoB_007624400 [Plakobranchus ocellatus]|uniref:Uncharacterized protein n=1 Tax=Plakobranchus ocellatus TaxID=259542 RepID=A0AAV4E0C4_9GAST|nr:hypothetical protein PoB_007624400 [Plakobranchus ocellatus]
MEDKEKNKEQNSKSKTSRHVSSQEKTWRTYSKSLIEELKEKLAARRARTLGLLSEGADLSAFCEVDTESDGLDDTSTQSYLSGSYDLGNRVFRDQHGDHRVEAASLSETSSLSDAEFCQHPLEADDCHQTDATQMVENVQKRKLYFTTTATECYSFSPPRADNTTMTSAKFSFQDNKELVSVGTECINFEDDILHSDLPTKTSNCASDVDHRVSHLSFTPRKHSNTASLNRDDIFKEGTNEPDIIDSPYNSALQFFFGGCSDQPFDNTPITSRKLSDLDVTLYNDETVLDIMDSRKNPVSDLAQVHASDENMNRGKHKGVQKFTDDFATATKSLGTDFVKRIEISLSSAKNPKPVGADASEGTRIAPSTCLESHGANTDFYSVEEVRRNSESSKNPQDSAHVSHSPIQTKADEDCMNAILISHDKVTLTDNQIAQSSLAAGDFCMTETKSEKAKTRCRNLFFTVDEILISELSRTTYKCTVAEILRIIESDPAFNNEIDKNTIAYLKTHCDQPPTLSHRDQNVSSNSRNDETKSSPRESEIARFRRNQRLQACLKKARLVSSLQSHHTSAATRVGKVVTKQAYERAVREFEALVTRFAALGTGKEPCQEPASGKNTDKHPRVTSLPPFGSQPKGSISSKTFVCLGKEKRESNIDSDDKSVSRAKMKRSNTFVLDSKAVESESQVKDHISTSSSGSCAVQTSSEENVKAKAKEIQKVAKVKVSQEIKPVPQAEETDSESGESHESGFYSHQKYTSSLLTQLLDYSSQEEDAHDAGDILEEIIEHGDGEDSMSTGHGNIKKDLCGNNKTAEHSEASRPTADAEKNNACEDNIQDVKTGQPEPEIMTEPGDDEDVVVYESDFETGSDSDTSVHITCDTKAAKLASEKADAFISSEPDDRDGDEIALGYKNKTVEIKEIEPSAVRTDTGKAGQEATCLINDSLNVKSSSEINNTQTTEHGKRSSSQVPNQISEPGPSNAINVAERPSSSSRKSENVSSKAHSSRQKSKECFSRVDWSSSDEDSADDISRDVSPAEILRRRQIEQVDEQLESLKEMAKRKRKWRSLCKRRVPSNDKSEFCFDNKGFLETILSDNSSPEEENQRSEKTDLLCSAPHAPLNECEQEKGTQSFALESKAGVHFEMDVGECYKHQLTQDDEAATSSALVHESPENEKVSSEITEDLNQETLNAVFLESQIASNTRSMNLTPNHSSKQMVFASDNTDTSWAEQRNIATIVTSLDSKQGDPCLRDEGGETKVEEDRSYNKAAHSSDFSDPGYSDNGNSCADNASRSLRSSNVPQPGPLGHSMEILGKGSMPDGNRNMLTTAPMKEYDFEKTDRTKDFPTEHVLSNRESCMLYYDSLHDEIIDVNETIYFGKTAHECDDFSIVTERDNVTADQELSLEQGRSISKVSADSSPDGSNISPCQVAHLERFGAHQQSTAKQFNQLNVTSLGKHGDPQSLNVGHMSTVEKSEGVDGSESHSAMPIKSSGEAPSNDYDAKTSTSETDDLHLFSEKNKSEATGGCGHQLSNVCDPGEISLEEVQPKPLIFSKDINLSRNYIGINHAVNPIVGHKHENITESDNAFAKHGENTYDSINSDETKKQEEIQYDDDDKQFTNKVREKEWCVLGTPSETNHNEEKNPNILLSSSENEILTTIVNKLKSLERVLTNAHQSETTDKTRLEETPFPHSQTCTLERARAGAVWDCPLCFPQNSAVLVRHVLGGCKSITSCVSPQTAVLSGQSQPEKSSQENNGETLQQCHVATQTSNLITQACQTENEALADVSRSENDQQKYVDEKFKTLQRVIQGISEEINCLSCASGLATSKLGEIEIRVGAVSEGANKNMEGLKDCLMERLNDIDGMFSKSLETTFEKATEGIMDKVKSGVLVKLDNMKTELTTLINKECQISAARNGRRDNEDENNGADISTRLRESLSQNNPTIVASARKRS